MAPKQLELKLVPKPKPRPKRKRDDFMKMFNITFKELDEYEDTGLGWFGLACHVKREQNVGL